MKPLVPSSVASSIDTQTKELYALSDDLLMESAADSLYQALKNLEPWRMVRAGAPLVAVCGKGNNAGDALALVRKAAFEGLSSVSALVPSGLNSVAERRLNEARRAGVRIVALESAEADSAIRGAALLLDGLAGTGMKGSLRPPYDRLAALMSASGGAVVAIDLPSGTCPGSSGTATVVKADYTLCISPLKLELYLPGLRGFAGKIAEVAGVFPDHSAAGAPVRLLGQDSLAALLPAIAPDDHKGKRGALGMYAGAVGTTGAAVLAARSASASGVGTVTVLCHEDAWPVLATSLSAQMVRPLALGPGRRLDAVLAGPGWGCTAETTGILTELLASDLPLVLDADALRMLASSKLPPRRLSGAALVLTPHPGEFAGLALRAAGRAGDLGSGKDSASAAVLDRTLFDTAAVLGQCAEYFNAVVVLKNHVSWIAAPDGRMAVWDGREPALGTGGSGDVLAGVLAGLLAREAGAFEAACAAVIAHGTAGKKAAARHGFFDASALPDYIARILYRETSRGNKG